MGTRRWVLWVFYLLVLPLILSACQRDQASRINDSNDAEQDIGGPFEGFELPEEVPGGSGVLQETISRNTDAILAGIDQQRVQVDLSTLALDSILVEMAYQRSIDMAVRGYLDHASPEDNQVHLLEDLQVGGFSGQAAELIFATQAPLEDVSEECLGVWFEDDDHTSILLSPAFHYAGVGFMGDGERWIVTVILVESRQ